MPRVHVNGADIFYQTEGSPAAPALVFCNSLGTDMRMWQAQAEALRSDFFIVRYDARGHGQSSAPAGSYTLAQLGQDALGVLDALALPRAHVCGLSMGGLTAQWLGIHAGERIHRLVIANSAARIGTTEGWRLRADAVRREGLGPIADGAPARWFTPDFIAAAPHLVVTLQRALRDDNAEGYASCCEALAAADLREDVARIANPTLVIAGEQDPVTTVDDGLFLTNRIAGAALVTVPASHLSSIEAPAAFTHTLADFLAD